MNHFRPFWCLLVISLGLCLPVTQAKIQFDVFPGYEGRFARAGAWYPVAFEIFNDGPSFDGVVEVGDIQSGGYSTHIPIELPANTKKVFTTTLYCPTSGSHLIDARLRDERGKIRDERLGQRLDVGTWESTILAGLPGAFSGMPAFPDFGRTTEDFPLLAPRLTPEFFPDNPLALEALNSLYLNTATALKLKEPQIDALLAWLHGGGHLIVAVDQPGDLNALTWLRLELPAKVTDGANIHAGRDFEKWVQGIEGSPLVGSYGYGSPSTPVAAEEVASPPVKAPIVRRNRINGGSSGTRPAPSTARPNQPTTPDQTVKGDAYSSITPDAAFVASEIPVYGLKMNLGRTLLEVVTNGVSMPLIVTQTRDRGRVTLLAFNPEREPIKSWKSRPWFWARLAGVPGTILSRNQSLRFGGRSLDGVFGAMIETRQVRKLPIGALLVLLLGYLVVIGPFDRWVLQKINRPMLTWVTFPGYVVFFSGLIYFIGWKLRAGKAEWNEFHVVDMLPQARDASAAFRGRTFASLYSPGNTSYPVGLDLPTGVVRPESRGLFEAGTVTPKKTVITQKATKLTTDLSVDIWTSQLNIFEWLDYATVPLTSKWDPVSRQLHLENVSSLDVKALWAVVHGKVYTLSGLASHRSSDFDLVETNAMPLAEFMAAREGDMSAAVNLRNQAFGGNERTHIDAWPETGIAASFSALLAANPEEGRGFVSTPGMDLSPLMRRGDAIIFAWMPDTSFIHPISQFKTPRFQKNTLLRWSLPPLTPPSTP